MPVRLWKPGALNWKHRDGKWYFEVEAGHPPRWDAVHWNEEGMQWVADNVQIPGAIGPLYQPTANDIGKVLTLTMTARNPHE